MGTYPSVQSDKTLTVDEVHHILSTPSLVARTVQSMANLSFIADQLLTGSADATGSGAVLVRDDEPLFAEGDPEVIAPGAEYPVGSTSEGAGSLIATIKKGRAIIITDEKISRSPGDELRRQVTQLVNMVVRDNDQVAMGVIASKVTATSTGATWGGDSGAKNIVNNVLAARAKIETDYEAYGYVPSTIVLTPTKWAAAQAAFINAGFLPRENGNPVTTGTLEFNALGFRWLRSLHNPITDPLLVDPTALGGVASETITSPEFVAAVSGVEVATERLSGRDGYRVRARRVGRPYVTGAGAGIKITTTA